MRTPLILAAAFAVAASSAAAANFDVNAADATLDDISSGTSTVDDCTQGLEADLVPGGYVAADDDWQLDAVTVESVAGDLALLCEGFLVTVVVENDSAGAPITVADVPATDAVDGVLTFDTSGIATARVNPATELSILVDQPGL